MSRPPEVLLLSRDPSLIETVRGAAEACSCRLWPCGDLAQAVRKLCEGDFPVLMVHLLPGQAEEDVRPLLMALAGARRACATVVLASHLEHRQVDVLLRAGVAECLKLPAGITGLSAVLSGLLAVAPRMTATAPSDSAAAPWPDELDGFGTNSAELLTQVRRVAPQETTVLLTGETGTGKTRLARLIHELSPRRGEPFLVVDCGALSGGLIESELFGHSKGAFTGADRERTGKLAAAGGGTLLLDEINSLPLALQSKLLRAADERVFEPVGSEKSRPMRARLIAASNVPLEQEVAAGRFRADLFYRLNVVGFFLPPLRDRRGSVPPLAVRFLREFAARNRPDVAGFSREALAALEGHGWPGNVRELRNVVERAIALCEGPRVEREDLPTEIVGSRPLSGSRRLEQSAVLMNELPITLARSNQEVEIRRILEALAKHGNNRVRAAAELGISRIALYKKLHKYGLMDSRPGA